MIEILMDLPWLHISMISLWLGGFCIGFAVCAIIHRIKLKREK